jgi:hypothetical protein
MVDETSSRVERLVSSKRKQLAAFDDEFLRKHGVSTSEAATCFLDPEAFTAPDKDYPDRFVLIGLSRQLRVRVVVSAEVETHPHHHCPKGIARPAESLRKWPVRAKPISAATI